MLKIFGGGKPDHPMADPKAARRILDELPAQDPHKALEELGHWYESVSTAEGFRLDRRIEVLLAVDEAAVARVRRLSRDYFATARPSRFQENRLWTTIFEAWRQSTHAFARCVDGFLQNAKGADAARSQLALVLVRAMRGVAQQLKWSQMRYGPIDAALWGMLNNVYAVAEARGAAVTRVTPYAGVTGDTSPREEFLRAVVFGASSPDSLLPAEIEQIERVIAAIADGFVLGTEAADALVWTDLGQAMPPQRLQKPPPQAPGLRYVGPGNALERVHWTIGRIEATGQIPSDAPLATDEDPEGALEVLRHLATNWSASPPERKFPRHAVKSRVSVTFGFQHANAVLGGSSDSLDFGETPIESWVVENVSAGGFGVVVPQLKGDWLRVGVLLALQPEGGENWVVGVVRRVSKSASQQARVGIETLARAPRAARFDSAASSGESGIVLPGADTASPEVRVVLRPMVFVAGQNLDSMTDGRHHVYIPQAVVERGEDYEIARFREMIRES